MQLHKLQQESLGKTLDPKHRLRHVAEDASLSCTDQTQFAELQCFLLQTVFCISF